MQILGLSCNPSKKFNATAIAKKFGAQIEQVEEAFSRLQTFKFIKDNPTSGNKVLTEEGKLFLEQTATVFPELNKFLNEQREATI